MQAYKVEYAWWNYKYQIVAYNFMCNIKIFIKSFFTNKNQQKMMMRLLMNEK